MDRTLQQSNRSPRRGFPTWRAAPALALLLAAAIPARAAVPRAGATGAGKGIKFLTDLGKAHDLAQSRKQRVVIVFTAPWCGWCRKMQATTFPDAKVRAYAEKFVWARVDIDKERTIAAIFGVRGVPYLVILDPARGEVGARGGYMAPAQLARFLEESLTQRTASAEEKARAKRLLDGLAALPAARGRVDKPSQGLRAALEQLAAPNRAGREALADAVRAAGPRAWAGLAAALGDRHLAIRAAAGEMLAYSTGQSLQFDPFAPAAARDAQAAAWRAWVAEHALTATTRPGVPRGGSRLKPIKRPTATGNEG